MPWTVYCHTHIESGRRYIGLTQQTMMRRWNRRVYHAFHRNDKSHFPNAIRKYGKEAFSHHLLEFDIPTLEIANEREEYWIDFYDTRDPEHGFNILRGGGHKPNKRPFNTSLTQLKRSMLSRAALSDPTVRAKISAAITGRTFSTVHRANLSVANERRAQDPVFAAKNKAQLDAVRPSPPSSVGRVHSQETKSKISSKLVGRVPSSLAIENSVKSRREKAVAKAYFLCKKHGPVSFTDCFQRKDNAGRVRYECKECKRTDNRARKLA
jgi:group I intron endonuclease